MHKNARTKMSKEKFKKGKKMSEKEFLPQTRDFFQGQDIAQRSLNRIN